MDSELYEFVILLGLFVCRCVIPVGFIILIGYLISKIKCSKMY